MPLVTHADSARVSVVIASYNARDTIGRCLGALTTLATPVPFEVVVVDSSTDRTGELVASEFPTVTLLRSGHRLYPGDARNAGVAEARGEILAFTDADCVVDQNWIDELVRQHGGGVSVVAGSIVNGNPDTLVSWANYFCEFSAWIPAGPVRPLADAPTPCLSVERDVFERLGPFVGGTLSSDSAFCWRLVRAGQPPQFAPQVRVAHLNVTGFVPYLVRKWRHGRAFARVLARESGFSRARCVLRVLVAPVVPVVLILRAARAAARARAYRREFVLSAPLVFVGQTAWALGEAVSYTRLAVSR